MFEVSEFFGPGSNCYVMQLFLVGINGNIIDIIVHIYALRFNREKCVSYGCGVGGVGGGGVHGFGIT